MLKKLINDPFDAVDEMLDGFVAAHADVVRLAAPRVVARRAPGGPKVGLVIGGGIGPRAGVRRVRRSRAWPTPRRSATSSRRPDPTSASRRSRPRRRVAASSWPTGTTPGTCSTSTWPPSSPRGRGSRPGPSGCPTTSPLRRPPSATGGAGSPGTCSCSRSPGRRPSGATTWPRSSGWPAGRTPRARASGSPCRRARSPARAGRRSRSGRTRSRSGWASTASPGSSADGSSRPTPSPSGWSRRSSPTGRRAASLAARSALLVNGLGATAYLDLYILYRAARRLLEAAGCEVSRSFVGEYITSLEMAGASISVLRLDDELLPLLDAPARTARLG